MRYGTTGRPVPGYEVDLRDEHGRQVADNEVGGPVHSRPQLGADGYYTYAGCSDALATELQSFVKQRLMPHKYPRQVEFIDELPKTATGKIQRFRLRDRERARR